MPRREINPTHDAYTDIKMAERMMRPLETSYNDEGAEQKPPFDIPAEDADPESLLISETSAEVGAEKVAEKLYQAQETDRHGRLVRRAAEAAAGWSPRKDKKADLSGRDRPLVEVEPAEAGEELAKQESIGPGTVNKYSKEMVRRYNEGRHEEKFGKHRQADKEKTMRLGQRRKIIEVLGARVEAGVPKSAAEDAASRRLQDFFEAHQDYLGDSGAKFSAEELFKYGRFTALDFFDFVDDFKDAPDFPALVKAARSGLQARLERDSDLAEHFLRMAKRNEKARESIPEFDELERIALERVKKPLSLSEQRALEKRYQLVVKEKGVAA